MSPITEAPSLEPERFDNPPGMPEPTCSQDRDRTLGTSGMGNVPEETNPSAKRNCEGKRPLFHNSDEYEVQFHGIEDKQDPRHFTRVRKWTIVVIISLTSASV